MGLITGLTNEVLDDSIRPLTKGFFGGLGVTLGVTAGSMVLIGTLIAALKFTHKGQEQKDEGLN